MPPPSKISQLPDELRQWLHATIVARNFAQIEAVTAELNDYLKEAGIAVTIGKSAVGAESQKVKRAQEAIKATTEAARLIAQSSPDAADDRSAAAMAIVQSEVFETLLQLQQSTDISDPVERMGVMNEAALGLSRLSRARVNQARWAADVEARAKAAADKVEKLARKGGMDTKTVAEIRASILGISRRETAA